jgi:uncharacterized protein (TIGR02687 family)
MARLDIKEKLIDCFKQPLHLGVHRRIVIWHDPSGEFEEQFNQFSQEDLAQVEGLPRAVRLLKAQDGEMFELKRLIYRGDTENDMLIYRQRAKGDLQGDWLADVEMYTDHFQADYISLLAAQLQANDSAEVREALQHYKVFFGAKTRLERFSKCMPAPQSADDVHRGVLAALLGGNTSEFSAPSVIIRSYLCKLAENGIASEEGHEVASEGSASFSVLSDLEKYAATEALEKIVSVTTGYTGELDDPQALLGHVLLSAASCTLPDSLLDGLEHYINRSCSAFCLGIVREWMMADPVSRAALYDAAVLVEQVAHLPQRFYDAAVESLKDCDVFPCINDAVLSSLLESMASGAVRYEEARLVMQRRRELVGYELVSPYFNVLSAVCDIQEFYQAHTAGFHEPKAEAVWHAYESDWWKMDRAYRRFRLAYVDSLNHPRMSVEDAARETENWVEQIYTNWYVPEANKNWNLMAEDDLCSLGYVKTLPYQQRFFDDSVKPAMHHSKTVVVIVSDALRYDVACDIKRELDRERGSVVGMSSMQAVFPSITEFGMAALLPHSVMELDREKNEVLVDGLPSAGTTKREEVLKRYDASAKALRAEDYLRLSTSERKALLKETALLYLYHNKIDSRGESLSTQDDVFDACGDTIEDLRGLASRVCTDNPSARVIITADHGFLYTRQELKESTLLSEAEIPGDSLRVSRRHALVDGDSLSSKDDVSAYLQVAVQGVAGKGLAGYAPRGAIRIKRPGGAYRYVHGGVSLQELCVPVITFRKVASRSKEFEDVSYAQIELLSANRRITSLLANVKLLQTEPAVGKVHPCVYELVFKDSAGNSISDVATIHADKESNDATDRQLLVRFTLQQGRTYSSKETYYLVAYNKETNVAVWKQDFQIEIFSSVDFGF